jgi:integrase
MRRAPGQLTIKDVRTAKPGPNGQMKVLCDGGGLYLRVQGGADDQVLKSWIFRYVPPNGGTKVSRKGHAYRRQRNFGLGPEHTIRLPEARELAREARALVLRGLDPIEQKNASRAKQRGGQGASMTFDAAAKAYLHNHEREWKSSVHRTQWHQSLRDHVSPVIGDMDVAAITTEDVLRLLEPIWFEIPETAARVRQRVETILDFAGRNGVNPARWDGHLQHKLPKRNRKRAKKHPALPYQQMAAFMAELRTVGTLAAKALEFAILTGGRTGEIRGADWSEIDWEAQTWTIPAERTKPDEELIVPLSDAAQAVLRSRPTKNGPLFPGLPYKGMYSLCKKLRSNITVHGFRATFKSWSDAETATPWNVSEKALGHMVGNATSRSYARDPMVEKRRVLMNAWAEFCAGAALKEDHSKVSG